MSQSSTTNSGHNVVEISTPAPTPGALTGAAPTGAAPTGAREAIFAGGCFWCMEPPFQKHPGVYAVISGYTGGNLDKPTYEQVSSGATGHAEAVRVLYDAQRITYDELLDLFWRSIDPTDAGGQFADRGSQYRSAIFYGSDAERALAEKSRQALAASGRFDKPIVTEIVPAAAFFPAEETHQDFFLKDPTRYKQYRRGSGRGGFLEATWGDESPVSSLPEATGPSIARVFTKPSDTQLRSRLTDLQYEVTQHEGTEPPFRNTYWDNKAAGIYVDIVSGEPLFSSTDQYKSGTGWPSFVRPLEPINLVERQDLTLGTPRTEVRSKHAGSHLGHVFPDGPAPTGLRYCINSAALRFIPKEDLEKQGYSAYLKLFAER